MRSREQRFFDAIASRYDRVYALHGAVSRARLARVVAKLPARARVLDLGVGTGRELSALLDAGHHPTGVDFSPEMLAICARRARPVPLVQADFWPRLPFETGAFDAAVALHGTLAHPPDDAALPHLVAELARVLTPSGIVVAEVPAPEWIDDVVNSEADASGRKLTRAEAGRYVYEDTVVGAGLEVRALRAEQWRDLFAGWTKVTVGPLVESEGRELLVVALR